MPSDPQEFRITISITEPNGTETSRSMYVERDDLGSSQNAAHELALKASVILSDILARVAAGNHWKDNARITVERYMTTDEIINLYGNQTLSLIVEKQQMKPQETRNDDR